VGQSTFLCGLASHDGKTKMIDRRWERDGDEDKIEREDKRMKMLLETGIKFERKKKK
jgi:hypothetical protein